MLSLTPLYSILAYIHNKQQLGFTTGLLSLYNLEKTIIIINFTPHVTMREGCKEVQIPASEKNHPSRKLKILPEIVIPAALNSADLHKDTGKPYNYDQFHLIKVTNF